MANRLIALFGMFCFFLLSHWWTPAAATDSNRAALTLTKFSMSEMNGIGEPMLQVRIAYGEREILRGEFASSQVDWSAWKQTGQLRIDWNECRTSEMERGGGELSQCLRRSFLQFGGEADRLSPGDLEVRAHGLGRLSVLLRMETLESPLCLVVDAEGENRGNLDQFVATLAHVPSSNPCDGEVISTNFAQLFSSKMRYMTAPIGHRWAHIATGDETGVVFVGDTGTGGREQYDVAANMHRFCSANRCDAVNLLGDNIYENGVSSETDTQFASKFERPFQQLSLPFYATLGNHDHRGNIQAQINYTARSQKWRMPGRYYRYDTDLVSFFVIDSDDFDRQQQAWLGTELASNPKRWKVVYGHHPVFSYGSHGNTSELVNKLLPLLKAHHVDFYLCGHDHDKQIIKLHDMTFMVAGTGAKLRSVGRGNGTVFAVSTYGFGHIAFTPAKAVVTYVDRAGNVEFSHEVAAR